MDYTDIVIGFAYGDLSYVADYYTRDRSTPRRDEFYGGVDSLTGAVGWEVDGTTTIIFRKKLEGTDKCDQFHNFSGTIADKRVTCNAWLKEWTEIMAWEM